MRPVGKDDQQPGAAVNVGVAVKGHVQTLEACILNQSQQLVGSARAGRPLVEMSDVGRDAAAAADLDAFLERVQEAIA